MGLENHFTHCSDWGMWQDRDRGRVVVLSVFYSFFHHRPGPEVINLFSSSTQLSMKFKLLINNKIAKIN